MRSRRLHSSRARTQQKTCTFWSVQCGRREAGVLHGAERALDVMLRPVAADNFHVAPVGIVGEDEGFAKQCALQSLPGAPVEPVTKDRQAVFDFDRHLKQLVTGLEPAGDPGSLRGRRLAVVGAPGAPTPQPVLEFPQSLSPLFPQQGCAVKSFSCDQHGALDQGARGAPGADAVEAVERTQPVGGRAGRDAGPASR